MIRNRLEYAVVILGIVALSLTIINGSILLALSTALIVLIALNRSEARYVALVTYAVYVLLSFTTGYSMSIIGIIFWFYICWQMYQNWQSSSKRITFIQLDTHMISYYANLFIILIVLNLFMYLIMTGFNLQTVLSIPVLYEVLISSLQFLGIYLIAMRIREGALFYAGYIVLRIILLVFLIVISQSTAMYSTVIVYVIQMLIIYYFYRYNS